MNRLGIDIGRVIIDSPPGEDTAFFHGDRAAVLRTPGVPGAFAAITRLVELFDGQAWLVSKCGPRIQQRSLDWLRHHDFFTRTGIPEANVRFCLRRPDKAIHCADLAITHFIDDKPDVHHALAGLVPHRYLFGPQRTIPAGLTHTPNWPTAEAAITATWKIEPLEHGSYRR
ncbi:hypothetical protein [Kribbella sp. CA-294648]|uniref:hypothetical protein n=1 Tax=Kribbella sp. CA-294648 TaxID=3239948 RepID=UPI003D910839